MKIPDAMLTKVVCGTCGRQVGGFYVSDQDGGKGAGPFANEHGGCPGSNQLWGVLPRVPPDNLPRYKHYNEASAPKHFWLYVGLGAFLILVVLPLVRPSVRAWWAWMLGL